ncbi:MAG: ATP-grasp domain-containing protein [Phycisphaerales bacterium]|nr:ATP-grasp domain-containing protein [Phycisphaerales bacterium]
MRRRRILVMIPAEHDPLPVDLTGLSELEIAPFKTEYDVVATLESLGHEVATVGVDDDLGVIQAAVDEFRPHVVFNLVEEFAHRGTNVAYLLGYLELIGQSYTGCNPVGMMLSNDKAMQRKILRHHRIRTPDFVIVRLGRRVRRPRRLQFPLIVKALTLHGSVGISQASVVHDDDHLDERVRFMHEHTGDHVIVEQFIEGRELYVGMLGNRRIETFPIWELHVPNRREGSPLIATGKLKWDLRYQDRVGVKTGVASSLPEALEARIISVCKRAYRVLQQTGYCRMDLRLDETGRAWLIESNPNPQLSFGEDFAESAEAYGLEYPALLQRIVNLGLRYRVE